MKLTDLDPRIAKYRARGICIDTNLLLLLLVGELSHGLIPQTERTRTYKLADFQLLKALTKYFAKIVTTPGILTEVSNLAGLDMKGERRTQFFGKFRQRIQLLTEVYPPSAEAARIEPFARLGLTDSALILACKDRYLAITADVALADYMGRNRLDVINFNHIRQLNWP